MRLVSFHVVRTLYLHLSTQSSHQQYIYPMIISFVRFSIPAFFPTCLTPIQRLNFLVIILFTDVDDCVNHTCANGGSCMDGVSTYTCSCPPGFTGMYCEKGKVSNTLELLTLIFQRIQSFHCSVRYKKLRQFFCKMFSFNYFQLPK